jgi:multidrug efflux pump
MQLKIRTPNGDLVEMSAIATLEKNAAPRVLSKFQQKNAFRIYGGIYPGITKEQALSALEAAAKTVLPKHYSVDYAGESRQLRQEGNTLLGVLLAGLVFVFMTLAVQFNSFRDPLVVLLGSVPLALSGAMLFTFLGWTTINIYSQVGFVTLVGLVSKNGILIVEFANHLQEQGLNKLEAIKGAAATRLRPVLMTAGATVLGHFPLVLVTGAGAEARNSIGIILVAGMLVGTLFTLYVLPCVYLLLGAEHNGHDNDTGKN